MAEPRDTSLYDPSYSFPSFHGISDSLRATIGDPPRVGLGPRPYQHDRDYLDSDYLLQPSGASLYNRRKKTVRFDSDNPWNVGAGDSGNESIDYGWMTIQDLRTGRWGGGGVPGGGSVHPGLAHRAPHLWDRQESLDSQARWGRIRNSLIVINFSLFFIEMLF